MNGVELDRKVDDPNAVIARLGDVLAGQGHEIIETGDGLLKTKRKGKLITADVTKMRLLVDLTASDDGGGVRFRFHTGLVASAWTDKDRQWAEEQVDALLAQI